MSRKPIYSLSILLIRITATSQRNRDEIVANSWLSHLKFIDFCKVGNFNIDKKINNQSSIDDNVNEYTTEENPIIISGNTLYIKLGGNGHNIGRKQNHVMIIFCLLNEGKEVLNSNHQYYICFYIGHEKYEDLAKVR
ncbi:hypothetical protein C1646_773773 [Rhizophagus diaphanus]|nr:hypothetical protein C1646_773773 [Rhizophagus diaphanus] [Rhizophagus sp. MUCL 43196]